jgi:hypothetical protein
LTAAEVDDRAVRWRQEITALTRARVIDASGDIDAVTSSILSSLEETSGREGRHFSARDGQWIFPRYPRKAVSEGLRLYHPMHRGTGALLSVARVGAGLGIGRLMRPTTPPEEVRAVVQPWLTPGSTYAVRRLRSHHRWLALILDREGIPRHALKIGLSDLDRAAIEAEKETIRLVTPTLQEPLAAPMLEDAPVGVLAMRPVRWHYRPHIAHLPIPVAAGLGTLFKSATGDVTVGRVHGDLAPWNLLGDTNQWVLVDWEASTDTGRAFHDLFHWVVQSHSLLSTPDADDIVDGLLGFQGNLGAAIVAFASAAGIDPELAPIEFGNYLRQSKPRSDTSGTRLASALSRRRRLAEWWRQVHGSVEE